MIVLGINYNHANTSACILENGKIICAVEEERFSRIKNDANFPINAIKFCLDKLNININKVDIITYNSDKSKNILNKILFVLKNININNLDETFKLLRKKNSLYDILNLNFGLKYKNKIFPLEHHLSHVASSFYCSEFDEAIGLSIDGSGDFSTLLVAVCKNGKIYEKNRMIYPNSLGMFYQSITQYLGFNNYGDEYKVMGLSAYGEDNFSKELSKLISFNKDNFININENYFYFGSNVKTFEIINDKIKFKNLFNEKKFEELFGFKQRKKNENLEKKHKDLACSLQKKYEEIFFQILDSIYDKYNCKYLVLAGGCAMNSLANGKILDNSKFEDFYIQPAAHDAGGALGAAMHHTYNLKNHQFKRYRYNSVYFGPEYTNQQINKEILKFKEELNRKNIKICFYDNFEDIIDKTVSSLISSKIVGWFQGGCEWGSRALGNRSILASPKIKNMKEILNIKIKKRESFRPFAPSVLIEEADNWFENYVDDPFMMTVCKVKKSKTKIIPSVTHVDESARIQTVSKQNNIKYHSLIKKFFDETKCPILLNTSFNENDPIVCSPIDAINTFLKTEIDILVMENYMLVREEN